MKIDELIEKYFVEIVKENPEIKNEIETIFEASVNEVVTGKIKDKETALEEKNTKELKEFKENLVDKIDEYATLSMTEFIEENKFNIETGVKVELAEKTIAAVKTLLTDASIDIPEDKKTIVEDLEKKVGEMTIKLNESVNSEIASKKTNFDLEKKIKFTSLSNDLSESKKEKLASLLENISCESIEDYEKKMVILKESVSDKKEDKKEDKNLTENKENFESSDLDKYLP